MAAFLAVLWGWTGLAYHLLYFTAINPAAYAFGGLFLLQAALFAWWGVVRGGLRFRTDDSVRQALAGAVLLYALVLYPLAGAAAGQRYMASPTFGAPCPAVIYTFGLLLLARRVPPWLVVIPVAWAVIGTSAVFAFGVVQDLGLVVSGAVYLAARAFRPAPLPAGA
ncbi:MAG: DUF6064 family protein [Gemmatimonadota bacterium]